MYITQYLNARLPGNLVFVHLTLLVIPLQKLQSQQLGTLPLSNVYFLQLPSSSFHFGPDSIQTNPTNPQHLLDLPMTYYYVENGRLVRRDGFAAQQLR